jgi:hypothetical protein
MATLILAGNEQAECLMARTHGTEVTLISRELSNRDVRWPYNTYQGIYRERFLCTIPLAALEQIIATMKEQHG